MSNLFSTILIAFAFTTSGFADIYLRDNLKKANAGDYLVTAQSKTYTLLHIYDKTDPLMTIEEISVPVTRINPDHFSWKAWVQQGSPGHTSWVIYRINLNTAIIQDYFSFTKNAWYEMPKAENFLSVLLNLKLERIPRSEMKKVGASPVSGFPDLRKPWQPKVIVEGQTVQGVNFAALRTTWPKDNSELSGKLIEVYVPEENERYPSYFPYWLQISGMVGKAKVRIIDSGSNLSSPKKFPDKVINNPQKCPSSP